MKVWSSPHYLLEKSLTASAEARLFVAVPYHIPDSCEPLPESYDRTGLSRGCRVWILQWLRRLWGAITRLPKDSRTPDLR